MKKQNRKEKLNDEIKHQKIRLIGDGFNGEIISLKDALLKANELELDLVLISENNEIGVCKIINYEKFIYELGKKPKPKILDLKEIKLGPNTTDNDLEYRSKHMAEFLQRGHKVKVTLQFRGREIAFINKGEEVILKLILSVKDFGTPETLPKMEGKKMIVIVKPKGK